MEKMTVTARVPKNEKKGILEDIVGSIEVEAPTTVDEAVKAYGEEAVLSNAIANWTVSLQGTLRNALRRGESNEEIQARLGSAKMGVSVPKSGKIDPEKAFMQKFAAASAEDRKKMLAQLKQLAAA